MAAIRQEDFIQSVADAYQFISYYHPVDYIKGLYEAYQAEQSPAAKDAMAQILINSRMSAEGHRPICQDTGIAIAFIRVGMDVRWDTKMSLQQMVDEGVRRAYTYPENKLRASILADPDGARKNTGDNTPAVVHVELVPGDTVEVIVAAKGGGSENKSKFAMLLPNDNIVDWVLTMVPTMGADWCPPGILSLGIGGSPEKAMLIAKWGMMDPINIHELQARGPSNRAEELRLELFDKVNALGIGAQGLGGLSLVLDVKVNDYPTHAASKPVALLPNCAATRHAHFTLDGSGPAKLDPPSLEDWPKLTLDFSTSRRVDLDTIKRADVLTWKSGERLLLSGKLLTGRDAAHKRLVEMMAARGEAAQSISRTASSITSVRSTRCATRQSVPPVRPRPRAWTSSSSPCWRRPVSSAWSASRSAARRRSSTSSSIRPSTVSRWAVRPTSFPRRSASRGCSRLPTSAWKRSTSSR